MTNVQDERDVLWARLTRLKKLTAHIEDLTTRSWARSWMVPLLCLVTPIGTPSLIPALDRMLSSKGRQIPHICLETINVPLEDLVTAAAAGLQRDVFGARPLRLAHFMLLRDVLEADLSGDKTPHKALARQLAEPYKIKLADLGAWERIPGFLPYLIVAILFWAAPGVLLRLRNRRAMAWFRRYERARSDRKSAFFPLATRFTVDKRRQDDPVVHRLMVAALLRDIQVLYKGIRARRHRTAYPVLLLDGVQRGNAGGDLLDLIDELRAEKNARSDPMLVVAGVGPDYLADPASLEDLASRFQVWRGELAEQPPRSWHLGVRLPTEDLTVAAVRHPSIPAPPPPAWARLGVRIPAAAVTLLLVVLGTGVILGQMGVLNAGCTGLYPPFSGAATVDVAKIGEECIGLSDTAYQTLGGDQAVEGIERTVFKENDRAARHPGHPQIMVVYLTSLTLPGGGDQQYVAERQGLSGIAAAQRQADDEADHDPSSPYVRIMVGNTGQLATRAQDVASKIIKMAADDKWNLLAVIAAVDSRPAAAAALEQITDAGIMVITPTMTADHLVSSSAHLFLRLSAPNNSAAALVHHYVTSVLGRTEIHNFYTFGSGLGPQDAAGDLYVTNLADDLRAKFGSAYTGGFWNDGDSLRDVCADRYHGVVFFGGRYTEFYRFAKKLSTDCNAGTPTLVADGSIARFLANPAERASMTPGLTVAFVGDGYLGSCPLLKQSIQPQPRLYLRLLGDNCRPAVLGVEAAGWSALSFDAVGLMKWGMGVAINQGSGAAHWHNGAVNAAQIVTAIKSQTEPYQGVTGPISFAGDGSVTDRYQSILCVRDISQAYADEQHIPSEVDSAGASIPGKEKPTLKPCA